MSLYSSVRGSQMSSKSDVLHSVKTVGVRYKKTFS